MFSHLTPLRRWRIVIPLVIAAAGHTAVFHLAAAAAIALHHGHKASAAILPVVLEAAARLDAGTRCTVMDHLHLVVQSNRAGGDQASHAAAGTLCPWCLLTD